MNQFLLRVCIGLFLLPVLLFVALWLGAPWRVVWWAVCAAGVLWSAYTAWGQIRLQGSRQPSWLFPAALVQTGLWGLAIALTIDTDSAANRPVVDAVGMASGIAIFVLLLTGLVGFGGLAVRMLLGNQAVQLQPRRAMWGAVLLAFNALGWAFVVSVSQTLADQKSNLSVVNYLAANDLQVFTPARYARELLGKHYIWMDDPATPPLGWWPFADAMVSPDDVIRKYAHPKDRWSGAYLLTAEDKEDEAKSRQRAFGVMMIDELSSNIAQTPVPVPASTEATKSATGQGGDRASDLAPQLGGRITDVKVDSPAASAGAQRGDTVVAVNGMPWAQWYAHRSTANTAANTTATLTTTATAKPPPSLVIRTRSGTLVSLDKKATFADRGVQQVAWLPNKVLYARLDGFKEHTAVDLAKALRELELSSNIPLDSLEGLVVDLRGNPGGIGNAAEAVGRLLLGNNLAKQRIAQQTDWVKPNPALTPEAKDKTLIYSRQVKQISTGVLWAFNWSLDNYGNAPRAENRGNPDRWLPRMKQVLLLTNGGSCSASEYLIHGLRTLTDMRVITVGQTTCGKPYGFVTRDYAGYQFEVVDMAFESPSGQSAYSNGIPPTCKVIDPIAVPFTALGDTVLEAALFYAQYGRCP